MYENCHLCPRSCGVDRTKEAPEGKSGFCGESDQVRVAYVGPHFGEEPPISGTHGSGTVFLTGCSLRCTFCQNHQISHKGLGSPKDLKILLPEIKKMIRRHHVHNINFVTPDHFLPHILRLVRLLRDEGLSIPVLFNLSGYQSILLMKAARDWVDIYLPDFKYADRSLAAKLSACPDYPDVAIEAIAEMIKQKGFLDAGTAHGKTARRGVLVRHLILPGHTDNSVNALTTLFLEFGPELPLSLMSQYYPVLPQKEEPLNRRITKSEFFTVLDHARQLGFKQIFVQFPEEQSLSEKVSPPFLPDFRLKQPFGSPLSKIAFRASAKKKGPPRQGRRARGRAKSVLCC